MDYSAVLKKIREEGIEYQILEPPDLKGKIKNP